MTAVYYVAVLVFTVTQSASTKLYQKYKGNVSTFNAFKSIFAFVPFLLAAAFGFSFHLPTVLTGCVYGILLSVSMFSGYNALQYGPMALTSMIVSFSVAIPVLYGFLIGEEIGIFKIIGLCLLVFAIVAVNADKKQEKNKSNRRKWLFYVFLTFFANGFCSVTQKIHQNLYSSEYVKEFMAIAMLVCSIVFLILPLFKKQDAAKEPAAAFKKSDLFGVLAGLCMAAANFFTTALVNSENASVLFPAISAGTLILTLFCGLCVFKEKLKINHYIAMLAGICSVIFLKL